MSMTEVQRGLGYVTTTRHTPGQWHISAAPNGSATIVRKGGGIIATKIRNAADARLIAEAPKMRDLLADVLAYVAGENFDADVSDRQIVREVMAEKVKHWRTLFASINGDGR